MKMKLGIVHKPQILNEIVNTINSNWKITPAWAKRHLMNKIRSLSLASWNVNGIRACKEKGLKESLQDLEPDIICLQEIKADKEVVQAICLEQFSEYHLHCSSAHKKGYSGVATLVKKELSDLASFSSKLDTEIFSVEEKELLSLFESEGRFSITRLPSLSLINVYIPSGTSGEVRQDLKMKFLDLFLKFLVAEKNKGNELIVCGDFNICHKEIDIHHPKEATKKGLTGFLPEERAWISKMIGHNFIDCFRHLHPDALKSYSWWSYRAQSRPKNLGWRIDYFFCSAGLCAKLKSASIHEKVMGSDHCPISLKLDYPEIN
jgi:exodeoxyribonuclease-3